MRMANLLRVRLTRKPHFTSKSFEVEKWLGAHKAVPAYLLSSDDTFKQKRIGTAIQLAESTDRSQGVAYELAVDCHDARPPAQLHESIEFWMMRHEWAGQCFLSN